MEDGEPSRSLIGFPLGLALLLLMLCLMVSLFACCLHWDKLRTLLGIPADDDHDVQTDVDDHHSPPKIPSPPQKKLNQNQGQDLLVLMPGDRMPKFIAIACPCEPPVAVEKIVVKVQKPPPFPVPLY